MKSCGGKIVPKGSVIMSCVGELGIVAISSQDLVLNQQLHAFVCSDEIENEYLAYYLETQKQYMYSIASKTTIPYLNKSNCESIPIMFPPKEKQILIVKKLSIWDTVITQTQQLIKAKQKLKRGLMQQLLSKNADLKTYRLKDISERITETAPENIERVLSITAKIGFVDQKEKFNKVIAGKNIEKYVYLKKGEFSYNKGNSKTYPQGCIFRLDEYEYGAVPNVYYSFRVHKDKIDSTYIKYYFESGLLNRQLARIINTGVRNDGLLNLSAKDFFKVNIYLPTLHEQKKIAKMFTLMDIELSSLSKKLSNLQLQKQGLMQKLLTGQIRVPVGEKCI